QDLVNVVGQEGAGRYLFPLYVQDQSRLAVLFQENVGPHMKIPPARPRRTGEKIGLDGDSTSVPPGELGFNRRGYVTLENALQVNQKGRSGDRPSAVAGCQAIGEQAAQVQQGAITLRPRV